LKLKKVLHTQDSIESADKEETKEIEHDERNIGYGPFKDTGAGGLKPSATSIIPRKKFTKEKVKRVSNKTLVWFK
jgi:hypothetical protein